jgi:hypothetical protein
VTRWVVLVWFRPTAEPGEVRSWLAAVNALEVAHSSVAENAPGSVGGGDAVWDLRTEGEKIGQIPAAAALLAASCLATTEVLALDEIASAYQPLEGARIKRTLALAVRDGTPSAQVRLFERSLQGMPHHIPEIRSWSLSRVRAERSDGRWTHVWEQEYADLEGLRVAYMRSPYHWAGVDRWFDPEVPCSIVNPRLAHMFRWADGPVLTDG